ncbi:dnaJ homolog subfamily C member 28 isoform X1 [Schistocerca americana]|uniref:dnaJ homolog subfamily C member 28 isoform X1 n=1 Tax=Schistocerca americana TaxID=7009 RepID=UPI001F4FAEC3|nr:dnaJ homolog subfamily C member 28 isoform X1 [Schistocerca americana]
MATQQTCCTTLYRKNIQLFTSKCRNIPTRNILFKNYSGGRKTDYSAYYHVLGLENGCDQEKVRTSFLELVKRYHPDSGSPEADSEKFHQIERAYRELQNKFAADRWNSEKGAGEYGLYYEENKQEFDIRHTAPQHRQYLSYYGIGSGTPQQRQKQYQKYRAMTAIENVYNHRISKLTINESTLVTKDKQAAKKIKVRSEMERLVEDLIQESIARGDFDNLSGSGKPLPHQNTNPYVDFVTHKMNQVMIDNGYVPEWITLQKEIKIDAAEIRSKLSEVRSTLGTEPLTTDEVRVWKQAVCDQEQSVKRLNKKINDYNLQVPLLEKQKLLFQINLEAEKILKNGKTKFDVVNKSSGASEDKYQHNNSSVLNIFDYLFAGKV